MINFKCFAFFLYLLMGTSFAGIEQAPPSFSTNGKKAVWVDFLKAKYDLTFNINNKRSKAVSVIEFEVIEKGFPIFDLSNSPSKVFINGVNYSQSEVSTPDRQSKVRVINKELSPGVYSLKIESTISSGVKYGRKNVSVGFFMSDLKDRNFLEKYLPSNYEYDQYKMKVNIKINGSSKSHLLYTNGSLIDKSYNSFNYEYPEYFTSSSLYFHLVPKNKFDSVQFSYQSRLSNGGSFPVTIYADSKRLIRKVKEKTVSVLRELEEDYGPWPHPQLIIYADGYHKGGMEYAGATITGLKSVGHELQHSYFARFVMPSSGNAGWVDEAVASWRDDLENRKDKLKNIRVRQTRSYNVAANLGKQSVFKRVTDKRSYSNGSAFIFYIDNLLRQVPGKNFKKFLRIYFENRKATTITTKDFQSDLESYYGETLIRSFNKYIYGSGSKKKSLNTNSEHNHNDHHPILSDKELMDLI